MEYVTEFIVIASLAAAGVAIDRPVSWKNWRQIWPLLVIAMPLTVGAVALLGWWALGLAPASAILLGAAMAPTDPVLARSVQVGPPGEAKRHDVRFSLTVEAGLNDGLAFPFTYLAIAAVGMTSLGWWTAEWAAFDLVFRIAMGCLVGWGIGRAGAWYVFEREGRRQAHRQKACGQEGSGQESREEVSVLQTSEGVRPAPAVSSDPVMHFAWRGLLCGVARGRKSEPPKRPPKAFANAGALRLLKGL